jgi:hypothetical protein
MRYLITLTISLGILAVLGCSAKDNPTAPAAGAEPAIAVSLDPKGISEPDPGLQPGELPVDMPKSLKLKVLENCRIVQAAAETFAAENGGFYPNNTADVTSLGNTLIDLLPDGMLLENPYWGARVEPVDGAAASIGQTGYYPVVCGGQVKGYTITGVGAATWEHIVVIAKDCGGETYEIIGRQ